MRLKPNFKPSIGKILFSIVITIAWIIYNILTSPRVMCKCLLPNDSLELCEILYYLMPIKNYVCCNCASILHLIIQIIIYIIIPFIIAYVIFALIYSLTPRRHKHGVYR